MQHDPDRTQNASSASVISHERAPDNTENSRGYSSVPGYPKNGENLMKIFLKIKNKAESGQALAEFAICLPLLILILCGILDFGWVYMNEYEVNHAAYEAARYASIHISDEGMTTSILENNMRVLINENLTHKDSSLSVAFDWPVSDGIAKVTVTNPVHMLTFVGMTFFGSTFHITVQNAFFAQVS